MNADTGEDAPSARAVDRRRLLSSGGMVLAGAVAIGRASSAWSQPASQTLSDEATASGTPHTLPRIDPMTALVAIDLQNIALKLPLSPAVSGVVECTMALAAAFRFRRWPVFLVKAERPGPAPRHSKGGSLPAGLPADSFEVIPGLVQRGDRVITKPHWGAFAGTALDAELRKLGVTQIVLAGVGTSRGIESTVRTAFDLGYNVTPVADAMCDADSEGQRRSLEVIFPRLGELAMSDDVIRSVTTSRR